MARIGLYPNLIIVAFGVVAPFFIFKLGRLIGFASPPRRHGRGALRGFSGTSLRSPRTSATAWAFLCMPV